MERDSQTHPQEMDRDELLAEIERLRWLVEAQPQVSWEADAEGNITDFSQRWLDLTGLTREEALGGGWVAAPHPDDLPLMVEAWTRSLATSEPYDVRHRLRVADGSHRWMHTWAIARRDASGRILAWFGSTEDVHDATVQTERLYATADALPAMVFHVDADLRYRFANRAVERAFGRPRSEILGRTVREVVGEDTYASVLPYLQKALGGEGAEWAMWVEFPSGRRFTRATYVPSLGAGGEVVGIDVLAVDETQARLNEDALRASEARQQFLDGLGQATADVQGAEEVMVVVARMLGRHLGVSRCSYALVEEDQDTFAIPGGLNDGVEPIVGSFRLSSFGPEMAAQQRRGEPSVVRDVEREFGSPEALAAYASIQVRSYVLMPLLRGGRLVALMSVDHREPRDWSPEEVELVRAVTERAWALVERARAERTLRATGETFESLVRNSPFGVYVVGADFRMALVSQGAQKVFENVRPLVGRDFAEVQRTVWTEPFATETIEIFRRTLETGDAYRAPSTLEERRDVRQVDAYDWKVERIALPDGSLGLVCHFYDLSERQRLEAELREARARTDAILVSADVATWVLDVRNDRLYADRNLARFFDLDEADANGGPASAYIAKIHPDDQARVGKELGEAIADGVPYDVEYRIVARGEERWVTARGVPEKDERGTVTRLPGVVVDVTALKRAEERERRTAEALRAGAERLRLLVESVPEIAWTSTPEGEIDYYNERWYEYTGRDNPKEGDESWMPTLHPEDAERTYRAWRRSVETGEPYETELRIRGAASGEYRWFLARARPMRGTDGRIVRWFGVTSDIDEQKRSQNALSLANRLGVALTQELDPERVVQALSDASTEAVGADFGSFFFARPEEERDADGGERFGLYVLSGAPSEAFASFPPVRSTPLFAPTFGGEGPVRSDDVSRDPRFSGMPAGHLPVRSYLAMPVRGRDGSVLGGLLFGHSEPGRFTEEHERLVGSFAAQAAVAYENAILYGRLREAKEGLERKVAERTADLQASNEALNGFTYHVAHDLRAPLRTIVSTSRIVQEDFGAALPAEAHSLLDRQATAASRLGKLIDDLLRLSRLAQQAVERAPVDLAQMAREVAVESLGAHPGTAVRVEVQDGLDAWADPRLLRLALGNLVENAVKYSPEGGTVRVGRREGGAYFVSDEGIGIDPAYFGKIFEPFQRLHSDEAFEGTGIGLSNVRQVVERHGGRLWVESAPGEGSTFLFALE